MSEYTGTSVRSWPGRVGVQASTARTTTSARDGAARGVDDGRSTRLAPPRCESPRCARRGRTPRRSTASARPRARRAGWIAAQCGVNGRAQHAVDPDQCLGLGRRRASAGRPRRSRGLLASSTSASGPGPLRRAARQVRPCRPWRSGSRCLRRRGRSADDVDGLLHGPAHRAHGRRRRRPAPARRPRWRTGPSTSRRYAPKPRSRPPPSRRRRRAAIGVGQRQRVGGPQSGEPGADDADVDLEVLGERGARRQRDRRWHPTRGRAADSADAAPRASTSGATPRSAPRAAWRP